MIFDKLVPSGKYIIYRKAVWLYLFLLIFEGALRKWVLPSLSTPLLLVRDPIVIWLLFAGFQRGWLKNGYAVAMMIVSTLSFIATLLVGHQNLYVAIYGWRTYFLYFPFIFILGKILTRDDLLKMGRFILYVSIPMTILIIVQFYSPQSAWVNLGVGGDTEGSGFSGALGYFRSSGVFSFTSGYAVFQSVVACFLFYYILTNNALSFREQIKSWLLWIMLGCYIISIPYSISRTHFFQALVVLCFVLIINIFNKQYSKRVVLLSFLAVLSVGFISTFNLATDSLEAFTSRFESANKIEGGAVEGVLGNRYLGSTLRAFNVDTPFFGYGIGLGTNAGAKMSTGSIFANFNGEEEWSRVMGESGWLFGSLIIAIRCLFALSLFKRAFSALRSTKDIMPWLLLVMALLSIPLGQFGNVTGLGFMALSGGLALAAVNTTTKKS